MCAVCLYLADLKQNLLMHVHYGDILCLGSAPWRRCTCVEARRATRPPCPLMAAAAYSSEAVQLHAVVSMTCASDCSQMPGHQGCYACGVTSRRGSRWRWIRRTRSADPNVPKHGVAGGALVVKLVIFGRAGGANTYAFHISKRAQISGLR